MSIAGITNSPTSKEVLPTSEGQIFAGQAGENGKLSAEEDYAKAEKTFTKVGVGIAGGTAVGLLLGFFKFGSGFPAKTLEVIGDSFGAIASVASPFAIIGNEIKNFNLLKGITRTTQGIFKVFDDWIDVFYRFCSVGFSVYIFKPFVDPEMFGKSIFHKIATVANIPNLLFCSLEWLQFHHA